MKSMASKTTKLIRYRSYAITLDSVISEMTEVLRLMHVPYIYKEHDEYCKKSYISEWKRRLLELDIDRIYKISEADEIESVIEDMNTVLRRLNTNYSEIDIEPHFSEWKNRLSKIDEHYVLCWRNNYIPYKKVCKLCHSRRITKHEWGPSQRRKDFSGTCHICVSQTSIRWMMDNVIIEKVKEARADIPCPYSGTSNCWGKKDYYNHSIPSSKKRIMYDLIDEYCREEEPDFIKDGTRWIPE